MTVAVAEHSGRGVHPVIVLVIVNTSFTHRCDCCSCWAQRTRCPSCRKSWPPWDPCWRRQWRSPSPPWRRLPKTRSVLNSSAFGPLPCCSISSFFLPGCAFWQTWSVLHSSALGCCTAVGIFFARLCVLTQSVLDYSALGCCTAVGIFFARFCVLTDMVSSPRVHFGPLPCCKVFLCQVHHCVVFFSSVFWRTWSVLHSLASGCCCGFCFAMRIILLFSPRRLCCFSCVFYKTLTVSSLTFFLWL